MRPVVHRRRCHHGVGRRTGASLTGLQSAPSCGAVPSARDINVGGHTWNVYRGSNGSNAVFSFLPTSALNAGTVDVLAVLNWLRSQGWWADVTVGDVQFGFELTGTAGQSDFVCNSFSITSS